MQILSSDADKETTVLFIHRENVSADLKAKMKELDSLLGLNPKRQQFKITYGMLPGSDGEISLLTRSILQIMIALAAEVEVPIKDVIEGRTVPGDNQGKKADHKQGRLIDIKLSEHKPDDAFTSVNYRDHWFWIHDRDFKSKRTFAFLMILFSLTETGSQQGLPLVTIPSG